MVPKLDVCERHIRIWTEYDSAKDVTRLWFSTGCNQTLIQHMMLADYDLALDMTRIWLSTGYNQTLIQHKMYADCDSSHDIPRLWISTEWKQTMIQHRMSANYDSERRFVLICCIIRWVWVYLLERNTLPLPKKEICKWYRQAIFLFKRLIKFKG